MKRQNFLIALAALACSFGTATSAAVNTYFYDVDIGKKRMGIDNDNASQTGGGESTNETLRTNQHGGGIDKTSTPQQQPKAGDTKRSQVQQQQQQQQANAGAAKKTGFAAMTPERQREIGKIAHANGRAHEFTSETARAAASKSQRSRGASSQASA